MSIVKLGMNTKSPLAKQAIAQINQAVKNENVVVRLTSAYTTALSIRLEQLADKNPPLALGLTDYIGKLQKQGRIVFTDHKDNADANQAESLKLLLIPVKRALKALE
jgi:hypothetical protein